MDKFTKVFEADMKDSLDSITEADNGQRKVKTGPVVGAGLVGGAAGSAVYTRQLGKRLSGKGVTSFGERWRKIADRAVTGKNPGLAMKVYKTTGKRFLAAGAAGTAAGATIGAGASYLRNRNKSVAESVLEEVRGRIAAKKLEEAGVVDAAKGLWEGFKKLKAVKQVGTMGRTIRGVAKSAPSEFGQLKASLGTAGALKQTALKSGKYLGQQAAANPYGTATIAGGTGLTAWGLKKPKKVQEAASFDFGKLKDKKGKDGEANPAQEALGKAKEKAKAKENGKDKGKRVRHFAKEDIGTLMRAGGPMIGKKRKSRFAENMERVKGIKDVKEIDKKEYKKRKKAGHTGTRNVHQEVPNDFIKGKRNVDVVVI